MTCLTGAQLTTSVNERRGVDVRKMKDDGADWSSEICVYRQWLTCKDRSGLRLPFNLHSSLGFPECCPGATYIDVTWGVSNTDTFLGPMLTDPGLWGWCVTSLFESFSVLVISSTMEVAFVYYLYIQMCNYMITQQVGFMESCSKLESSESSALKGSRPNLIYPHILGKVSWSRWSPLFTGLEMGPREAKWFTCGFAVDTIQSHLNPYSASVFVSVWPSQTASWKRVPVCEVYRICKTLCWVV